VSVQVCGDIGGTTEDETANDRGAKVSRDAPGEEIRAKAVQEKRNQERDILCRDDGQPTKRGCTDERRQRHVRVQREIRAGRSKQEIRMKEIGSR